MIDTLSANIMSKTPRTDKLIAEHAKLRSNTLNYPTEQALIQLAKELEAELAEIKRGFLGDLIELSKTKGAVTFQQLTNFVRGFKALPANGKRWKKNEEPVDAEIRYRGKYEDALEFINPESENIAYIIWIPRKEFLKLQEEKKNAKS